MGPPASSLTATDPDPRLIPATELPFLDLAGVGFGVGNDGKFLIEFLVPFLKLLPPDAIDRDQNVQMGGI